MRPGVAARSGAAFLQELRGKLVPAIATGAVDIRAVELASRFARVVQALGMRISASASGAGDQALKLLGTACSE